MRLLFTILLLPFSLAAQDTTLVKQQANRMAQATFKGDYKTIIAFTYPRLVNLSGGADSMQHLIAARMDNLKKQGITGFNGSIGSAGQFYTAGEEIHCLLPEEIIIRTTAGRYRSRSYLLGISGDKGKTWTFLDVGSMPADVLHRLLPNFNNVLVIPAPVKPEFLPD